MNGLTGSDAIVYEFADVRTGDRLAGGVVIGVTQVPNHESWEVATVEGPGQYQWRNFLIVSHHGYVEAFETSLSIMGLSLLAEGAEHVFDLEGSRF